MQFLPSGGAGEEAPAGPLPGKAGGTVRRRRRGAPLLAANGAPPAPGAGSNANSLLLRRGRLKRNLSAAATTTSSSSSSSSSSAAAASHSSNAASLAASCSASASLCTRSLDRKTLLLKHRQMMQLQPSDRDWVRHQLQRGCVHVFDRHMASTYLRPVLCTLDTTAGEVAARLLQLGHKGGGGLVMKVLGRGSSPAAQPQPSWVDSAADPPTAGHGDIPSGSCGGQVARSPEAPGPGLGLTAPDYELGEQQSRKNGLGDPAVGGKPRTPPGDLPLRSNGAGRLVGCLTHGSPAPSDFSPGDLYAGVPGSLLGDLRPVDGVMGGPASDTESFSLSPSAESVSDRLDPYSSGGGGGSSSSSEELEADSTPVPALAPAQALTEGSGLAHHPSGSAASRTGGPVAEESRDFPPLPSPSPAAPAQSPPKAPKGVDSRGRLFQDEPLEKAIAGGVSGELKLLPPGHGGAADKTAPTPTLYVQFHGETTRRLEAHEKPLQIQNDYLFQLGFRELWRVQEEGMDSEIGCLIRFYAGKPHITGSSERIQLSGMYNVRKGKMQLPVNRWTRRQVILCGTCLIVSSVKDSLTGKMHVLPLIGGKVEEVKKHQHCLAFSSSGPQSQTYYICFDTFTEYLRWLRQVSKVASQRISSVDLSCCSLEHLPANLFYSQDLTHLNLKQNFLRQNPSSPTSRGLGELKRFTKLKSLNLSNNHLGDFPLAVCNIPTLTELNVSCNALRTVPAIAGDMHNLQTFLLDGNYLQSLPAELENMQQLSYLGLSFNEFTDIPKVLEKLTAVDKLCMSGNCMEMLNLQALRRMPHIKHVDLR